MAVNEWMEHRRADSELIGRIRPHDSGFVPVDRLGRDVSAVTDWMEAERVLDELDLGYLGDPFELRIDDGSWRPVRIVEASPTMIRGKEEDFGAIGGTVVEHALPLPVAGTLRERRSAPEA